ncbi:DUF5777 family beta-barrel protein, partial [Desulfobacterales bacterium HSG17]|nr:DUF5777 family beta-barrel protein [Desulfobacterales bacterium HSG17]
MQIAVEKNELYQIIKQAVRDVIREEYGDLWLNFLNYVSDEEMSDLMGIYGPSNIRLGFNYGITKRIMVGFGAEKNNKLYDFHWKYQILQQTKSNSTPLAIAYYGNIVINSSDKTGYGENFSF